MVVGGVGVLSSLSFDELMVGKRSHNDFVCDGNLLVIKNLVDR